MTTLLDSALWYAKHGWAVLPLHTVVDGRCSCSGTKPCKPGKHPRNTDGVTGATKDPKSITDWWTKWPDANIGIAAGQISGIVVLDVDVGNGGVDTLDALEYKHGKLPDTVQAITGGGGAHYLFAYPAGEQIGNSTGKLGPGLDTRGNGGYIVVEPSIHESGRRYAWEASSMPGRVPLAPLPQWVLSLLIDASSPKKPAGKLPDKIPEGQRNGILTSVAGSMRRRGMSEGAILAALSAENLERCDPPLDGAEIEDIAHSVSRYSPDAPAIAASPKAFNRTDSGNAELLVAKHGEDLRWCAELGWLVWDGKRWQAGANSAVNRLAKMTIRNLAKQAIDSNGDDRTDTIKHAIRSESKERRNAMVDLARHELAVQARAKDYDTNPWLFTCKNGTLDLQTGTIRPHKRIDMITKMTDVEYRPDAKCPLWDAFLTRILDGNQELTTFLQRCAGYSLTGSVSEQVLLFLYGAGANGKSTFIQLLLAVLGDYAIQSAPGLLIAKHGDAHPTEQADLAGARMVATIEVDEGKQMAEGLMKQLTGGDRVKARHMRQDFFEFEPTWKLWLLANHKPQIRGRDLAIWRRIRLVPFSVTIPEGERDRDLPQKMKAELPGILAWCVRGCLDWQSTGLHPPSEVLVATEIYREEEDYLGPFFEECTQKLAAAQITKKDLYHAYSTWAERNGFKVWSSKSFSSRMLDDPAISERKSGAVRYWTGISLLGTDGTVFSQNPVKPIGNSFSSVIPKSTNNLSHLSQNKDLEIDYDELWYNKD